MDKLKMQTPNKANENFDKLAAMFPNAVTESINENGEVVRAIDKDVLMQEISCKVVEGREERYQFTWPDKKRSILTANAPINKTLRPCKDESVDFDKTENLYIEGDNLEVLKLLQETYLGKIKMIYIDPPYNTGNDFVYNDEFEMSNEEWKNSSGNFDEEGNQLTGKLERNTENNGRFHTDWLNMIYPRLKVARDLLMEDGVIFISIDDNEVENLRKVCDEIFGDSNFIATLIWQRAFSPKNDAKFISNSHDYIVMYAKVINNFHIGRLDRTEEANARYSNPDNDPRGVWMSSDISVKTYNASCDYAITTPSGKIIEPPAGRCWSLSRNAFLERLQDNRIWFGPNGDNTPRIKRFLSDLKFEGMAPTSVLLFKEVGHSQEGAQEVVSLFGDKGVFDGPKPIRLLQRLITLANLDNDSIVLDFFSGSASTAHALMQMNAEKKKSCKFIMVQIPEEVSDKKKNVGYDTICEIGKERIRRAGKKIKEELAAKQRENGLFAEQEEKQTLDTGFRVLKLDSSNMQDVYYAPSEYNQDNLFAKTDNVKPDRTPEDLLFQVMLELGATLDCKIEQTTVEDKTIFNVAEGYLFACFDSDISDEVVKAIAEKKPYYAVFRDSSMADDSVMTNFEQIFASISPTTVRKVL